MHDSCGTARCIAGHIAWRLYLNKAITVENLEDMQHTFYSDCDARSIGLSILFHPSHPSDPQLAADAIERYVYDGSDEPWKVPAAV